MRIKTLACAIAALFATAFAPTLANATLLINGGFELPDASAGDLNNAPGAPWIGFNDPNIRFTTTAFARTGSQSVKMFGPFDFIGGGVGAVQAVPAIPGATYSGSVYAYSPTGDAITGNNFAVYKLEFLDAGFNLLPGGVGVSFFESNHFNASSPLDTWVQLGTGGVAPAGTAFVQAVIVHVQLGDGNGGFVGGATFFDDASVTLVPEPASLLMLGVGCLVVLRRRR